MDTEQASNREGGEALRKDNRCAVECALVIKDLQTTEGRLNNT